MAVYQRQGPTTGQSIGDILSGVGKVVDIPNQQRIAAQQEFQQYQKMGLPLDKILSTKRGFSVYAKAIGMHEDMLRELMEQGKAPTPATLDKSQLKAGTPQEALAGQTLTGGAEIAAGAPDLFKPEKEPSEVEIDDKLSKQYGGALDKIVGNKYPAQTVNEIIRSVQATRSLEFRGGLAQDLQYVAEYNAARGTVDKQLSLEPDGGIQIMSNPDLYDQMVANEMQKTMAYRPEHLKAFNKKYVNPRFGTNIGEDNSDTRTAITTSEFQSKIAKKVSDNAAKKMTTQQATDELMKTYYINDNAK